MTAPSRSRPRRRPSARLPLPDRLAHFVMTVFGVLCLIGIGVCIVGAIVASYLAQSGALQ